MKSVKPITYFLLYLQLFVEICEQTANVNCIKAIIKSKLDLFAPIILDSTFQIINETKFTRGSLIFYFAILHDDLTFLFQ